MTAFISILLILCSCDKYTNLNSKSPYKEAIGKEFLLQNDYYIYKVHGATHTYIGTFYALPKLIKYQYIGLKK